MLFIVVLNRWFGIIVGIFCFLAAIFNYYVMKTHPFFDEEVAVDENNPHTGGNTGHHQPMGDDRDDQMM